jgi:hypothetical protein
MGGGCWAMQGLSFLSVVWFRDNVLKRPVERIELLAGEYKDFRPGGNRGGIFRLAAASPLTRRPPVSVPPTLLADRRGCRSRLTPARTVTSSRRGDSTAEYGMIGTVANRVIILFPSVGNEVDRVESA